MAQQPAPGGSGDLPGQQPPNPDLPPVQEPPAEMPDIDPIKPVREPPRDPIVRPEMDAL
jgi:hypothetical protein